MKNIPLEKLHQVSARTGELITEVNEGIKWVDSYLQKEESPEVNYKLKKYRRYLRNIKNVIARKMVISLFGKSQVGKSYLVDGILSTHDEKDLRIPDITSGNEYSFIEALNPPGGKESTGVVSRFSIEKNTLPGSLPIEIKLLSPKDVILILCDAYYSDIRHDPKLLIRTAQIVEFLPVLDSMATDAPQSFLTEDDIYDIQDYLWKYFKDKPAVGNFVDGKLWDKLAAAIGRIAPGKWSRIFELLWGRNSRFSGLFNLLIAELGTLDFSGVVHTHFEALLTTEGSILDVARLFELNGDPRPPIEVQTAGGKRLSILRSRLAALTYEVTIPIKEQLADEKQFLQNVDILDFPGARAREMSEEETLAQKDDESFFNFYRRGKVAYLFNRYTENYEISSLLFCIDNEQLEVKNLPSILDNWIGHYLGKDAEERAKTLNGFAANEAATANPLLIIFTKANLMLQYKPIDAGGQLDYKWETRFKSIFVKEYCKDYDWYDSWVKTDGRTEKFRNLYLLRSFNYPEQIFEGFRETGKETGISNAREGYMNDLRQSFVNYPFNRDHFMDPERSWLEFTNLNKDGSDYIIRNISPIATNGLRTNRYINQLNAFRHEVAQTLRDHYHNETADGQIRAAAREGAEIHAIMNIIFGKDAYHFGNFIEHFTVPETALFGYYHDELRKISLVKAPEPKKYQLIREGSPRLSPEKSFRENLEVLRLDYHRDTLEETEAFFTSSEIDLDELFYGGLHNLRNNSQVLAEGARDYWFDTRLAVENFQTFIDLGFEKRLLVKLLDNMKKSFDRLGLTKVIAEHIRLYVDSLNRIDMAEEMIAHITAGIINEFVNSVGWTYYSKADKQKIAETNAVNNLNLIFPEEIDVFQSPDKTDTGKSGEMSVERLIGFMDNLNENLNRIPIDIETIRNVPMIRNYRRWREQMKISFIANCNIPTYNVAANRLLGDILNKIDQYEFQL